MRSKHMRKRSGPRGGLFGFGDTEKNRETAIRALRSRYPPPEGFDSWTRERQDAAIKEWINQYKTVYGQTQQAYEGAVNYAQGAYNSVMSSRENANTQRGIQAFKRIENEASKVFKTALCVTAPNAAKREMGGISGTLTAMQQQKLQELKNSNAQYCAGIQGGAIQKTNMGYFIVRNGRIIKGPFATYLAAKAAMQRSPRSRRSRRRRSPRGLKI